MSGLFTLSDIDNVNDDVDDVADAFVTCEGHLLADLEGGARDTTPPPGAKIPSLSCSFRQKLVNIVGWRHPQGNPGSVTAVTSDHRHRL